MTDRQTSVSADQGVARPGSDGRASSAAQFRARVRPKGQLTIPTLVRQLLGLEAGDVLEFEWDGETIMLSKSSGALERALADVASGRTTFYPDNESFLASLEDK